jgi:hypothetical protein
VLRSNVLDLEDKIYRFNNVIIYLKECFKYLRALQYLEHVVHFLGRGQKPARCAMASTATEQTKETHTKKK